MLEQKKCNPLLALIGAAALFVSLPAMAQNAPAPTPASSPAAATAAPAEAAPATESADAPKGKKQPTPIDMFIAAKPVVQAVMILLLVAAGASWTIFIVKSFNFGSLNKQTNAFLEAFRGARTISDIRRIATAEEFEGNPFADMASVASHEVEMSRQAGLSISGEHRDSTIDRAHAVINAVQATLAKRLSGGSDILASVGSTGPFVGLFGTVYGIMDSFIGIAATNTTSLAVVAPGIAEALLATALGLFAAIPSVIFYNLVQGSISAYGGRSEGFVTELGNTISRLLDKGA